ncbi:hypothetical protein [Actinomadura sp. DC4]|uniref:hypothetical protein n=1 Tax=Actinomadura sp. DC4 TaxID=3055069 RepID=UPI0025B1BAAD|nr:hypothetical protein [Actinomadura sp. DC4]MDN3355098.1 hypothetical protein [Actinomadura sp. DC4]
MKGRHARALAGAATMAAGRRPSLALVGAAGLGLTLATVLLAVAALIPGGSGGAAPRAATVNVLGGQAMPAHAEPVRPMGPVRPAERGDQAARAFYTAHDPLRARHVTEVVWTGPMLRVYTDLPAADADSKTAIALCETAAKYLTQRDHIPVVFVHADKAAGYPVLANKMDASDDCRLGRVP